MSEIERPKRLPFSSAEIQIAHDVVNSLPEHIPLITGDEIVDILAHLQIQRDLAASHESERAEILKPFEQRLKELEEKKPSRIQTLLYWPKDSPAARRILRDTVTYCPQDPVERTIFEKQFSLTAASLPSEKNFIVEPPEPHLTFTNTSKPNSFTIVRDGEEITITNPYDTSQKYKTGIYLSGFNDENGDHAVILCPVADKHLLGRHIVKTTQTEAGQKAIVLLKSLDPNSKSLWGYYAIQKTPDDKGAYTVTLQSTSAQDKRNETLPKRETKPQLPALTQEEFTRNTLLLANGEISHRSSNRWTVENMQNAESEEFIEIKSQDTITLDPGSEITFPPKSYWEPDEYTGIYLTYIKPENGYRTPVVRIQTDRRVINYKIESEEGEHFLERMLRFRKYNENGEAGQTRVISINTSQIDHNAFELKLLRKRTKRDK